MDRKRCTSTERLRLADQTAQRRIRDSSWSEVTAGAIMRRKEKKKRVECNPQASTTERVFGRGFGNCANDSPTAISGTSRARSRKKRIAKTWASFSRLRTPEAASQRQQTHAVLPHSHQHTNPTIPSRSYLRVTIYPSPQNLSSKYSRCIVEVHSTLRNSRPT
jgi:hypothetical protein